MGGVIHYLPSEPPDVDGEGVVIDKRPVDVPKHGEHLLPCQDGAGVAGQDQQELVLDGRQGERTAVPGAVRPPSPPAPA